MFPQTFLSVCLQGVPQPLVLGPFPASGPRSFPGGYPSPVTGPVQSPAGGTGQGVPPRQDEGNPPDRTGGTPSPWDRTGENPWSGRDNPQTGEQVMLCHGRYTSCGHSGRLSCILSVSTQVKDIFCVFSLCFIDVL